MNDPFPNLPHDFGHYRLLRRLGIGGMGAVYLAEDTTSGPRQTAIKIPTCILDPVSAGRFQREGAVLTRLQHPNICPLLASGEFKGRPYLAMQYFEGTPLNELIGNGKSWPVKRAIPFVMKLCEAFQYAHDNGVFHRDIKPSNVLVLDNGDPMILDFGIAHLVDASTLTYTGDVFGSPSYMSPEQANGKKDLIGPQSDVYSLGIMLFEILSGHCPYKGRGMDVLYQHVHSTIPQLRSVVPLADPRLETVCQKAMAKEPHRRHPSMREFRTALAMSMQPHPIITSVETTVLVPGPPSTPAAPSPTPRKAGDRLELLLPGNVPLTMAWCPPGAFRMGSYKGSNDEKPVHTVGLTQGFWMGIYPVTQAQWHAVMGDNPSYFQGPNRPVEKVSWDDAMEFIVKASKAVGQEFRLPTEAQWEYACRAGSTTEYCNGDDEASLRRVGWFANNSNGETHPVGELQPNAWGLHDSHGNVWEWCNDWYHTNSYARGDCTDPTGPSSASARVLRGGSWHDDAWRCRPAYRYRDEPGFRFNDYGFRLAAVPVVGAR